MGLMLCSILCNLPMQSQNFVSMATSLENLSNIMEIPDHDNPTLAAKILKLRCTGLSYAQFCAILPLKFNILLP